MSYYPTNFYSGYPYNQYQGSPMFTSQNANSLQGKLVDSEDMVRVTDVPMGGYGVFPKADFSEVYVKTWNANGTTSIITFKPVAKEEPKKESDTTNLLLDKIQQLEGKIDAVLASSAVVANETTQPAAAKQNTTIIKRKEF